MEILEFKGTSPNERHIERAVRALQAGEIIIYPTDTLYALGCDVLNARAIEALCRLKGINPEKQLLSVVCADISQAAEYARIDNRAFRMLKANLPGPFTFILPADTRLPKVFKGRKSVGVRVPDCAVARSLAEALGHPVLSASIVPEEGVDEVLPAEIAAAYQGKATVMLDAGEGGTKPSTVVDLMDSAEPEIIRQGAGEMA